MQVLDFVALVPMKAHSQRVPNKNVRLFGGKPLYHHVLGSLLACPYVSQVCINTDSTWIAEDATKHFDHVQIIPRPTELCGDTVSMNAIVAYDLGQTDGEYYLQTHSTNPLLLTTTITQAIETFWSVREEYDSLFSVTRLQTRLYNHEGKPLNHNPRELLQTQDLPPIFEENSNLYIFTRSSFYKYNTRIGDRPLMCEIPRLESVDVDEESDFVYAEFLYLKRKRHEGHA